MAITKLGHMKECSRNNPTSHLKNAIAYILNPEKTENLSMVGGNSGSAPKEIYDTFLSTKEEYQKMNGRQGYHFIISFKPGEATAEQVYKMARKWCDEYLGEDYDYVFAVHNDQKHLHAHVIFNSVSRTTGYKYHYVKNDWKYHIQPVTDRLCEEMGLPKLEYQEWQTKGEHYAEHMAAKEGRPNKKDILLADIDAAIKKSSTYEDFLLIMSKMDYQVLERFSKKKGESFLYFKSPEMKNARRSYSLGKGYGMQDIKDRIFGKQIPGWKEADHKSINVSPRIYKAVPDSGTAFSKSVFQSQKTIYVTRYQLGYVRRIYRAKHINSPYARRNQSYRKDVYQINRLAEQCRYLFNHQIQNPEDLRLEIAFLKQQLKNTTTEQLERNDREKERLKKELRIAKQIIRDNEKRRQSGTIQAPIRGSARKPERNKKIRGQRKL